MTHYLDIKFLPDEECDLPFLCNKLYTKLHKAIFDLKATDIGISFPQAKARLGCTIRIHSSKNRLDELQAKSWLGGLSGYCKVGDILPVPDKIDGYQTISRIRQTMTGARLAQRVKYQKEKGVLKTDNEIKAYVCQYTAEKTIRDSKPYLELQSTSTNGKYRLYIAFGKLQKQATHGKFNRFGLSPTATVPIF